MASTSEYDFSNIPDAAADEIYRSGEICLSGTVQLAIAADQRATTMAGVFGAGAVALLAVAATVRSGEISDPSFMWASVLMALILFFAALLCAYAGRPIDFFVGGYEPRLYVECAGDPYWMRRYASEDIQRRIESNRLSHEKSSRLLNCGALMAAISPIFGAVAYFSI